MISDERLAACSALHSSFIICLCNLPKYASEFREKPSVSSKAMRFNHSSRAAESRRLPIYFEAANPAEAIASLKPRGPKLPLDSVTLLAADRSAGSLGRRRHLSPQQSGADGGIGKRGHRFTTRSTPRRGRSCSSRPRRIASSGTGSRCGIRSDANWNVPEPELALVLNSRDCDLVGFTIGNDMSSRDIEGENPLYLPQAKVYDACCGLGPVVTLAVRDAAARRHRHSPGRSPRRKDRVRRKHEHFANGPNV